MSLDKLLLTWWQSSQSQGVGAPRSIKRIFLLVQIRVNKPFTDSHVILNIRPLVLQLRHTSRNSSHSQLQAGIQSLLCITHIIPHLIAGIGWKAILELRSFPRTPFCHRYERFPVYLCDLYLIFFIPSITSSTWTRT